MLKFHEVANDCEDMIGVTQDQMVIIQGRSSQQFDISDEKDESQE